MRVRVVRPFEAYWNYAVQQFEGGAEYLGELARHLADNAPADHVEVLEDDREELRAAAAAAATAPVGGDSEQADDSSGDGDGPPVDGTIDALMKWVGDDPERAEQALAAEQAKDKPRTTAIKLLTAAAGTDDQ